MSAVQHRALIVPIHSFQSLKDSIFVWGRGERGAGKASAPSLGPPDLFVLFGQVAPRGWGTKYWLLLDKHRAA